MPICESSHNGTFHVEWDNGRSLGLGEDSFTVSFPELHTLKLYIPLTASIYKSDEYGSMPDIPCELNCELTGVAQCRVLGGLSDAQLLILKDYITAQAFYGWGENFEQHPVKIGTGELYVSLWNASESWQLSTAEELSQCKKRGMSDMSM